jgi:nicotinamidase-related amidase
MAGEPSPDSTEFFTARGFGTTIGFGQRPAVVVVDLINGFTNPEMPLGSDLDGVVSRTEAIVVTARAIGIPVLFTTVAYSPDLADAGVWFRKQRALSTLIAGTPAVEVDARLARRETEGLIAKKYASSFFGTDLASRLTARAVDTLIITGATTSGCVRCTAVDAVQLGFRPMVVRDAVGDRSPAAHDQSLFDLEQKYADVVTSDDVIAYLGALDQAPTP